MSSTLHTIGYTAVYLYKLLTHRRYEGRGYALSEIAESRKAVLIVPGFLGTRGALDILGRRFARVRYPAFSLDPGLTTIMPQATVRRDLFATIRELRSVHPEIGQLDLVGHSLGGLLALDAVEDGELDGLETRIVTLGSPFRGTWAGLFGGGLLPGANDLLPIMKRYREVGARPLRRRVPFLSISGKRDVLAPPERCFHPEAENVVMDVDHAGLVIMKAVFERVLAFLTAA